MRLGHVVDVDQLITGGNHDDFWGHCDLKLFLADRGRNGDFPSAQPGSGHDQQLARFKLGTSRMDGAAGLECDTVMQDGPTVGLLPARSPPGPW